MQMRRPISVVTKNRNCIVKTLNLIVRQSLARRIVCSSQVSHDSIDAHVAELLQPGDEVVQLIETNSEPAHSRIDFYMNVDHDSCVRGCLIQRLNHIETI